MVQKKRLTATQTGAIDMEFVDKITNTINEYNEVSTIGIEKALKDKVSLGFQVEENGAGGYKATLGTPLPQDFQEMVEGLGHKVGTEGGSRVLNLSAPQWSKILRLI